MGKRANGEGSIFKLPDGRWKVQVEIGRHPESGRRIRRTRTCRTRADAVAVKEQLLAASPAHVLSDAALTVGEFLNQWIELIKADRAENTLVSYERAIRLHIKPHLGHVRLSKLNVTKCRSWIATLRENEVGAAAIEASYIVLNTALNSPEGRRQVPVNPLVDIAKPKREEKDILPFESAECRLILQALKPHRLYPMFLLLFSTGMRQAEAFGLLWSHVSMDDCLLRIVQQATSIRGKAVVKTPKTPASRRTITLPRNCVDELHLYRKRSVIDGNAGCNIVFPSSVGTYLTRGNIRSRIWGPTLERLGIRLRGLHHARHTYATQQLAAGVPAHVVSKILGHSSPAVTLRIYAHLLEDQQKSASEKVSEWLG